MFNKPCQKIPPSLRLLHWGSEASALKSCQRYNRWTCFSLWQQGPNIHERKTWIKCCVLPVNTVTMPGWVTRSSAGIGLLNYSPLCLYKSGCCHSHIVYHFFFIVHERCAFLSSHHQLLKAICGLQLKAYSQEFGQPVVILWSICDVCCDVKIICESHLYHWAWDYLYYVETEKRNLATIWTICSLAFTRICKIQCCEGEM